MIRAYRYRFYPSGVQAAKLDETLRMCQKLYNAAIEEREYAHRAHSSVNYYSQQDQLPGLKKVMPEYKMVHSQVLQDVLHRIDGAYTNFFARAERRKKGERVEAGHPRFKALRSYRSITYPQAQKFGIVGGHVILPKVGKLRVFMHRDPKGEIKTMHVKRDRVGGWFISLVCELPDVKPIAPKTAVGVDVGLIKLVQASDGKYVKAEKFYRKSEEKLARAQKELSRKQPGSKNREKARLKVAKINRKVERQRNDFLHKVSKGLAGLADLIVVEDLRITNMAKNHRLSKSIYDSSWGRLAKYTTYKAESAGRSVARVDPRGTTCECMCWETVEISLSERTFRCPKCGLVIDRDLHSSFRILAKVGWEAAELTPVEMGPLLETASPVVEAGSPSLEVGGYHIRPCRYAA